MGFNSKKTFEITKISKNKYYACLNINFLSIETVFQLTLMCLLRLELWLKHLLHILHLWGLCFSCTCNMCILSLSLFSNDLKDIWMQTENTCTCNKHWRYIPWFVPPFLLGDFVVEMHPKVIIMAYTYLN